jgi:hypothetical protein
MRRTLAISAGLIVVALGLGAYVAVCIRPELNHRQEHIDITSGRRRYQRHLLGVRVVDRTEETEFSQLYRRYVGEPGEPQWRLVGTVPQPDDVLPHRRPKYHQALAAAQWLATSLASEQFTDPARKRVVERSLELLQRDGDAYGAQEYALHVNGTLASWKGEGEQIDVRHLPRSPRPKRKPVAAGAGG